MYAIQFKERGARITIWCGYATRQEALSAVKEVDHMIPLTWTWEILPEDQLPQQHK
jgi:hypothetical protein